MGKGGAPAKRSLGPAIGLIAAVLLLCGCRTALEGSARLIGLAQLAQADGAATGAARLFVHGGQISLTVAFVGDPGTAHHVHLLAGRACEDLVGADLSRHGAILPMLRTGPEGSGTLSVLIGGAGLESVGSLLADGGSAIVIETEQIGEAGLGSSVPFTACGMLRSA